MTKRLTLGLLVVISLFTAQPASAQRGGIGYPAFNIDSWTIDQETLARGDVFNLTLIFSNVGTFGANEVLVEVADDPNFTGLGTSPRFGEMGIGAQVSATIQVGIAETIEDGFYGIPVEFTYHHSALGGERLSDIRTIGVTVDGLSPFRNENVATGAPTLVIDSSVTREDAASGTIFLDLNLTNTGTATATNIVVNLDESQVFIPAQGASTAFQVGEVIQPGASQPVTLPLAVVGAPDGQVAQSFTINYSSYVGGTYQGVQRVPILLEEIAGQAPRVLVERYTLAPDPATPGSTARLNLSLANVGAGEAREVFVRLGQDSASLGPLVPVGSSNVLFVDTVPAGNRLDIGFDIAVDVTAEAGLIPVDVTLTYNNVYGVETVEVFTISVRVDPAPQLTINLFEAVPEPLFVGQTVQLPLEVINIGTQSINVSNMTVESDILNITQGSQYIGPLDGGTSGSLIANAEAVQPGTATVIVTVNYLDSFNQPQQLVERLTFTVEGETVPADDQEGGTAPGPRPSQTDTSEDESPSVGQRLLRGLVGFFGFGTREPVVPDLPQFQS